MKSSRRAFVKACGALTLGVTSFEWIAAQSSAYADSIAADNWMQKWMGALGAAVGPLHVGRFADPMYYLLKEIAWTPNAGQTVPSVRVPLGFVTDFTSIPQAFWSLLRPDVLYTFPAILHDYLYWEQKGSRADADLTLRYAMEEFKVRRPTTEAIYAAVSVGGATAWRTNASLKLAGEKRIIRQFPTDAKTPWSIWKKQDVF